ncbi:hypothetical protein F5876DRAFT_67263 [Lentinula aff. lateritia]|uniref:Uncharacterized protein n=1 Tax=Lentinula aff. lateritia TaxID=2804960 RepID=A0ACC1TUK5_9AGAR|nr:hypothetical protein F5876DRAFT_67263 [Lentinula aff. lateritia]
MRASKGPAMSLATTSAISVLVTRSTSLPWEYKFAGQIRYNTLVLHPNPFAWLDPKRRTIMRIAILVFIQLILAAYAAPLDMLQYCHPITGHLSEISQYQIHRPNHQKRLPVSKSTIEPPVVRTWLRTAFAENYDCFDESWKTVFENGLNETEVWQEDSNDVFTIKFEGIGNGLCHKNWCTMNVDQQGHGTVSPI